MPRAPCSVMGELGGGPLREDSGQRLTDMCHTQPTPREKCCIKKRPVRGRQALIISQLNTKQTNKQRLQEGRWYLAFIQGKVSQPHTGDIVSWVIPCRGGPSFASQMPTGPLPRVVTTKVCADIARHLLGSQGPPGGEALLQGAKKTHVETGRVVPKS